MQGGRRAIVLVIDACGIGALPDAADYGDQGTNTLAHLAQDLGGLSLPCLQQLGLGNILPLAGVPPSVHPAIHGRLHALGPGKDSTSGHWELMGAVLDRPLPTYPEGLPQPLLDQISEAMGAHIICNRPSNGITAIEQFGAEHLQSGELILYTSTDSVVQIAAHVELISEKDLYAACVAARDVLSGEHAVGRVIARPFTGPEGAFVRTDGRRDYTVASPQRTYLQQMQQRGVQVHGVGKIGDLFGGTGIAETHPGATNAAALASTAALLQSVQEGMIFVNLIETDQVYGHRKDIHGFHAALQQIDAQLAGWLQQMRPDDLLMITADHGVDLRHPSGDHTREHAPLLAITGAPHRGGAAGERHDGPLADVGASALWWLTGERVTAMSGESFVGDGAAGAARGRDDPRTAGSGRGGQANH
jgi:phosphopentomutase